MIVALTPEQRDLWVSRLKVGGMGLAVVTGIGLLLRSAFDDAESRAERAAAGPCADAYERLREAGYDDADAMHILSHPSAFGRVLREVGVTRGACAAALRVRA